MNTPYSSTVYDKINNLVTYVNSVYSAFIQHTKYFFTNNISTNATDIYLNSTNDIYLLSTNNNIHINTSSLCISSGENLPNINNYAVGSLFILTTTGELYIKQNKNDIINWYVVSTS
jgi:hypothetical protein